MPQNFTTPPGRFIQGDVFEPSLTDQQGNQRVWPVGSPKAGQPRPQWFMALAFAKNDPAWPPFKALLDAEAAAAWPSLFPQGAAGPCVLPTFSNKIVDGDAHDTTGKANADKAGHAGHWIVRFTSDYAPKAYRETAPGSQTFVEITDPTEIKRGYYVRNAGSTKSNETANRPGIKVYHNMVQLFAKGEEILSGPSAAAAFGAPAVAPVGAQALPPPAVAPVATPAPPAAAPPLPPAASAPAAPPPPVAPAPPYTGHMHDPLAAALADGWIAHPQAPGSFYKGQDVKAQADLAALYPAPAAVAPPAPPPAPPAPPPAPPAPPAGPVMTDKAAGQTYQALIAAGWSHELLLQHGYIVA